MTEILYRGEYLIKEHPSFQKTAYHYDIFDVQSGDVLMECREENLHWFTKILRFSDYKRLTPFYMRLRAGGGSQVVRIQRGVSSFSKAGIFDENDRYIGGFQRKLFSLAGDFEVIDGNGESVCKLKGKWTEEEIQFVAGDTEFARMVKKEPKTGLGAGDYVLRIFDMTPKNRAIRRLLLAAAMCLVVLKSDP